eukprot:6279278-Amphidinium_carterae.2
MIWSVLLIGVFYYIFAVIFLNGTLAYVHSDDASIVEKDNDSRVQLGMRTPSVTRVTRIAYSVATFIRSRGEISLSLDTKSWLPHWQSGLSNSPLVKEELRKTLQLYINRSAN